jgi:CRISPR-associated endonuclease/helicase Cas3
VDRDWPRLPDIVGRLRAAFDSHMATMKIDETPVNRLRADILAHARAKAVSSRGVCSLFNWRPVT